jgi:hypothetical protein
MMIPYPLRKIQNQEQRPQNDRTAHHALNDSKCSSPKNRIDFLGQMTIREIFAQHEGSFFSTSRSFQLPG